MKRMPRPDFKFLLRIGGIRCRKPNTGGCLIVAAVPPSVIRVEFGSSASSQIPQQAFATGRGE
jgi:hypothetical protein